MKTFKRALIILALLAGVGHAGFYFGGTRDHGHTRTGDGGSLANPDITGGSSTFTAVTSGQFRDTSGTAGEVTFYNNGGRLDSFEGMTYSSGTGTLTVGEVGTDTMVITSTSGIQSGAFTDNITFSMTTAGSNRALLVFVADGGLPGSVSVTYNGVAMTRSTATAGTPSAFVGDVFYLAAPASGAHDVVVTIDTQLGNSYAYAVALSGVDQTSPIVDADTANGTAASSTITVTTVSGGYTFSLLAGDADPSTITPATANAGETLLTSTAGETLSLAYKLNGSSMTWTLATSGAFGHAVVSLRPGETLSGTVITPDDVTAGDLVSTDDLTVGDDAAVVGDLSAGGAVSFSAMSYVVAVASGPQTVSSNTITKVNFQSESVDTLGEFASSVFTASRAGRYEAWACVNWPADATGSRVIQILPSGIGGDTGAFGQERVAASADIISQCTSYQVQLPASGTLRVNVYQNSGGNLTLDHDEAVVGGAMYFRVRGIP